MGNGEWGIRNWELGIGNWEWRSVASSGFPLIKGDGRGIKGGREGDQQCTILSNNINNLILDRIKGGRERDQQCTACAEQTAV
ncbi:MAG: hypothetical protein F6K47_25245 [Symploca sp. SIO2E6]|nr:hypothetical protein [Symploca sp. SIO2E6]